METQTPESPAIKLNSTVDASQPFRSVKEAVAIFGERLLTREILSSPTPSRISLDKETPNSPALKASPDKPFSSPTLPRISLDKETPNSPAMKVSPDKPFSRETHKFPEPPRFALDKETSSSSDVTYSPNKPSSNAGKQVEISSVDESKPSPKVHPEKEKHGNIVHGNDLVMMLMILKRLESELQETKIELKLLKERGSETEVALASLNAELHKNMSKIAKAEAVEAAKAATKPMVPLEGVKREMETRDEEKPRGDVIVKSIDSPTLAQILSISDYESYFGKSGNVSNKLIKQQPIIPLVTDIFPRKKKSSTPSDTPSPLFSSRRMYFG